MLPQLARSSKRGAGCHGRLAAERRTIMIKWADRTRVARPQAIRTPPGPTPSSGESSMQTKLVVAAVAALLCAGVAQAKECKGVTFPEQVQAGGTTLALNGLGLRQATFLKINVYVAALYVAKTSSDAAALLAPSMPKELTLQFVRDVGVDDITKGWSEGFEKNAKAELAALKERITMLNGWMTDIKTGQRLTFVYTPGAGVQVDVNGTVKGTIKGDDFARAFFSIWLGDPPNPELKAGLLGGACG
jgi:hypothetical protein